MSKKTKPVDKNLSVTYAVTKVEGLDAMGMVLGELEMVDNSCIFTPSDASGAFTANELLCIAAQMKRMEGKEE